MPQKKANSYDIEYANLFLKAVFESDLKIDDQLKLSKKSIKEIASTYSLSEVEKITEEDDLIELEVKNKTLLDA